MSTPALTTTVDPAELDAALSATELSGQETITGSDPGEIDDNAPTLDPTTVP